MDELDILDVNVEGSVRNQKRPVFLTVLCILTFVGGGIGILYSFIMWATFSAMQNMFGVIGDGQDEVSVRIFSWFKLVAIAYLAGSILCVGGAIFMMFMRKIGFYLYILGQAIPLILLFIMLGATVQNEFGMVWIVFMSIFPVGFIVMYGLNFKYLR